MELKQNGEKEKFETGAQRDTELNKPRFDLIPVIPLLKLSILYAKGGKHYGFFNWAKGIKYSRIISSMLRHLFQYIMGDRNEDHMSSLIFGAMCLSHFDECNRSNELNDLDNRWFEGIETGQIHEAYTRVMREYEKDCLNKTEN